MKTLPIISYENQNILLERSKLENIRNFLVDNNTLSKADLKFLNKISKKYRIKTADKHKYDLVNDLLDRVDVIPNSIVLAQAANESGWGHQDLQENIMHYLVNIHIIIQMVWFLF